METCLHALLENHQVTRKHFIAISNNSEASASELLEIAMKCFLNTAHMVISLVPDLQPHTDVLLVVKGLK